MLNDSRVATIFRHRAHSYRLTYPIGKRRVEQLNKHSTHIVAYPLIEYSTQESTPLLGRNRIWQNLTTRLSSVHQSALTTPRLADTLDNGCKLQKLTFQLVTKETIKLQRVLDIGSIDRSHSIPLHAMPIKQSQSSHNIPITALAPTRCTQVVVHRLWAINRYAHQEIILAEKLAPLIIYQRSVGLYAVRYATPVGILALQLQRTLIK